MLTVLVDEHADGDAAGVETVQEVLDVVVSNGILLAKDVFVLNYSLSHGGDHLVVPVPDVLQDLHKPGHWWVQERKVQKVRLEGKEVKVILSSSACFFLCVCLHSRLKDTLVIGVLVQELQDLHQALDVPEGTHTETRESHLTVADTDIHTSNPLQPGSYTGTFHRASKTETHRKREREREKRKHSHPSPDLTC